MTVDGHQGAMGVHRQRNVRGDGCDAPGDMHLAGVQHGYVHGRRDRVLHRRGRALARTNTHRQTLIGFHRVFVHHGFMVHVNAHHRTCHTRTHTTDAPAEGM